MEGHRWQRTLDAITRIHRPDLAPERWPAALEAVATALDAGKAAMFGVAERQDIAVHTGCKRRKAEFEKTRSNHQAERAQRELSGLRQLWLDSHG